MSVLSKKSRPPTSKVTLNAISSPESESGVTLFDKLYGPMIYQSGQEAVLANLLVPPVKKVDSTTQGTSGPTGSGSFASVTLTQSLANKLRAKTDLLGSTLFRLTWKERVTPLGRSIPALRASVLRTSGSGSTSWPTPNTPSGGPNNKSTKTHTGGMDLEGAATLTSWATPTQRDHKDGGSVGTAPINGLLGRQVWLAGWQSPTATAMERTDHEKRRQFRLSIGRESLAPGNLREQAMLLADSGQPATGSPASTEKPGQLNPAHSRWLMGLPTAWDSCGAMVIRLSRRKRKLL